MPILPDYQPSQGQHRPASPSVAAASAPGRAMQALGQSISGAGDMFATVQNGIDQGAKSRARLGYQNALAEHEEFRAQNPDESTWENDLKSRLGKYREGLDLSRVSPGMRAELEDAMVGWESDALSGTRIDGLRQRHRLDLHALNQDVEALQEAGDFEGAAKRLREARGILIHPVECDVDLKENSRKETVWKEQKAEEEDFNRITDDPAAAWDEIQKGRPDGMSAERYVRRRDFAKRELAMQTLDVSDRIEDGIFSGKIRTPEEIDDLAIGIRPGAKEKLKDSLARKMDLDFQRRAATPEYQEQVAGEVSRMLRDWDPEDEKFDEKAVEISSKIRTLPTGAMREELERQMSAVRSGKKEEATTHAREAQRALDDFSKIGGFGRLPEIGKIPVKKFVDDGFFRDVGKLQRLGFSEGTAKDISEEKDPSKAQKMFIDEWSKRNVGSIKASPDEISIANAIRLGHGESGFDDPESIIRRDAAQAEHDRAYGAAKAKLTEWIKRNPDAKEEAINNYVRDLSDEQTQKKLSSGVFERKSTVKADSLPANLVPYQSAFERAGARHGVDPRLLAAISMHETANGKSSAFLNKNNAMGVSNSSGPISFGDVESSINRMASLIGSKTSGPYKNARTLQELADIYAPVGAENDPGNLNQHWVAGVSKYLKQLGGNPSATIK